MLARAPSTESLNVNDSAEELKTTNSWGHFLSAVLFPQSKPRRTKFADQVEKMLIAQLRSHFVK